MFGTVGRAHVKPENQDQLVEVLRRQAYGTEVPGFVKSYVMFPQNRPGEVLLVAIFEDEASYRKNADDPSQHERYLEYRALMDDEPEWSDGEWFES
ncbi:MAG TPA: antibiotic biosynthesis monooxygenase [Actinomycetota bacterium]|nr:antibiotic biosynthesis monooxygenase [Actinomycetota bacterium]